MGGVGAECGGVLRGGGGGGGCAVSAGDGGAVLGGDGGGIGVEFWEEGIGVWGGWVVGYVVFVAVLWGDVGGDEGIGGSLECRIQNSEFRSAGKGKRVGSVCGGGVAWGVGLFGAAGGVGGAVGVWDFVVDVDGAWGGSEEALLAGVGEGGGVAVAGGGAAGGVGGGIFGGSGALYGGDWGDYAEKEPGEFFVWCGACGDDGDADGGSEWDHVDEHGEVRDGVVGDVWVWADDCGAGGDGDGAVFLGAAACARGGDCVGECLAGGDGVVVQGDGVFGWAAHVAIAVGVAWMAGAGVCGVDEADAVVDGILEEAGGVGEVAGVDEVEEVAVCDGCGSDCVDGVAGGDDVESSGRGAAGVFIGGVALDCEEYEGGGVGVRSIAVGGVLFGASL